VLGISLPGPDELGEELVALLEAVKAQEDRHRIRITLSSEGRLLTANPCEAAPESITAVTDPHPVNERGRLAHVKSTSYGEYRLALEAAQAAGAQEAILVNVSGDLCEGATSNVFFARDGVLHTPSLECGCLPGVTRKLLLAALRKSGVEVREGRNPMTVLESCDEVLVTSTLKNVCPVSNLDERQLDTSGPFAQLARESFDAVFGC